MKNFTKIKTVITTLGITIVSFLGKVLAQFETGVSQPLGIYESTQFIGVYGTPQEPHLLAVIINLIKWAIVPITLIIGIISFIRIKKTDDKKEKKIKVIRTSITITILILLIIILYFLQKVLF